MNSSVISAGGQRVLKFDCKNCRENPSISKSPECLKGVISGLKKNANIDKILLNDEYVREYKDKDLESLKAYIKALEDSRYLALKSIKNAECTDCDEEQEKKVESIWNLLIEEPDKGLAELRQLKEELKEKSQHGSKKCRKCRKKFLELGLEPSLKKISEARLAKKFEEREDKSEDIFSPTIRPSFLRSKLRLQPYTETELIDAYKCGETKVRIYYSDEKLEYLYFIIPPEYKLPPTQVRTLLDVKKDLLKKQGSLDPTLARDEIEKQSKSLIMENALENGIDLRSKKVESLAKSLSRFTAGLGMIETLLSDDQVQDIYVDAPIGKSPVYIYHQEFEECQTNVFLTPEDAQVLTSRFRAISGRPFSEADPTLDLNLKNVRIAAIQKPLSPGGLALAIRRHKSTPWTLPLFIKKKFLTPEAGGLLSLLVDSQTSILVTGSRGAGKTSLLGALMLELLPKYRILCLEDTAELPIERLRALGYKAQRLQVRPSSSGSELEMTTEGALRAALRLGESVLIMGEVRGPETKSLYEAMRVGAAGNSVMGTIHGSSTKDVFERVVFDLGIPPSSFKATDAIAVASPIRKKGSIDRKRRLTQISEVGKSWKNDPLKEEGFKDLMKYRPQEDKIMTAGTYENSDSQLLKKIADKWSMSVEEVQKNIELRRNIQKRLVETSESIKRPDLLEAGNVVRANLAYHRILEEELENGETDYESVYTCWERWFKEELL